MSKPVAVYSSLEYSVVEALAAMEGGMCSRADVREAGYDFTSEDEAHIYDCAQLCAVCPVRQKCYDYANEHNEIVGIWGGVWFFIDHKRVMQRVPSLSRPKASRRREVA